MAHSKDFISFLYCNTSPMYTPHHIPQEHLTKVHTSVRYKEPYVHFDIRNNNIIHICKIQQRKHGIYFLSFYQVT